MTDRRTIVLVDDDDDTRAIVEDVLKSEGYAVHVAKDGREALEILGRIDRPQLVLLDLMMPVMNGWQVLQELDALPHLAALPVVVFTAAGDAATEEISFGRPIVRKPIDLDLLLAMVARICDSEMVDRDAPSDLLPKHG